MRIIGGELKGRRVPPLKGFEGRPTTDFGRESLFNLLRSRVDLDEADVLDLFAGTGMVSLEFASRGARSVTAVEREPRAVRHISAQFKAFGLDQCTVIRADVADWLQRPLTSFDLVFADPPYDWEGLMGLPEKLLSSGLLVPGGLLVVEHGERTHFEEVEGFSEHRQYGQVHFSFFRR